MRTVNSPHQSADRAQPSARAGRAWPWWSVASILMLALVMLAGAVGSFAFATRKPAAAEWPTAVLVTVTPKPAPTYIVVTSAPGQASTPVAGANTVRAVRVNGTQGLSLRIRSAPGTQSDTIKLVPDGTRLLIIGDGKQVEDAQWWPVRDPSDNQEGWAVSTYLVPEAGP